MPALISCFGLIGDCSRHIGRLVTSTLVDKPSCNDVNKIVYPRYQCKLPKQGK